MNTAHAARKACLHGERGTMPTGIAEIIAAWDDEAHATVGSMCAEPDCLHMTQRRYPGLPPELAERCPIHAEPSHAARSATSEMSRSSASR